MKGSVDSVAIISWKFGCPSKFHPFFYIFSMFVYCLFCPAGTGRVAYLTRPSSCYPLSPLSRFQPPNPWRKNPNEPPLLSSRSREICKHRNIQDNIIILCMQMQIGLGQCFQRSQPPNPWRKNSRSRVNTYIQGQYSSYSFIRFSHWNIHWE